eukprot:4599046-Prymnesium_polylepis.2
MRPHAGAGVKQRHAVVAHIVKHDRVHRAAHLIQLRHGARGHRSAAVGDHEPCARPDLAEDARPRLDEHVEAAVP